MNLLLDTHTFIWWASNPENLSKKALSECENPENSLILSVVSAWEMQIKSRMGKLSLDMPFKELIESQQKENDLKILPIELKHIFELNNLPNIHNDPFDRLLIAQSNLEGITLVSKDNKFSSYPVSVLW
ncbi:type II toxin-antitoxin system VapC family toxin [Desulfobacterium sp. N47]|uniref:PIN domain-containing protein n=1 Tax=uncultured Desulfobacterium sp. TaxID=201089 RepID=E1YH77_9BACT|nr:hypothetical protein N47_F16160 [uncultured Desulfobacterium sp.]